MGPKHVAVGESTLLHNKYNCVQLLLLLTNNLKLLPYLSLYSAEFRMISGLLIEMDVKGSDTVLAFASEEWVKPWDTETVQALAAPRLELGTSPLLISSAEHRLSELFQ
jgi:hypothetical protein